MAPSNKRKNNSTKSDKVKKIDSYFKPVDSTTLEQETHVYKKVKLQTRTLLKHKLVSHEADQEDGSNGIKKMENHKEEKEEEEEEEEEKGKERVLEDKSEEKKEEIDTHEKDSDQDKRQQIEKEEDEEDEEDEEEEEEEDKTTKLITIKTKSPTQENIFITETQELDTQNVPLFNTQTQTDTIGSPITYTVADEDDIDDSFFDLSKSIHTQTNDNEKEDKQQKEEEQDADFIFSSTQESSLDDIFNCKESHVNIVSLDCEGLDFSQTTADDNFKLLNLPDTNLSFPSSTLE